MKMRSRWRTSKRAAPTDQEAWPIKTPRSILISTALQKKAQPHRRQIALVAVRPHNCDCVRRLRQTLQQVAQATLNDETSSCICGGVDALIITSQCGCLRERCCQWWSPLLVACEYCAYCAKSQNDRSTIEQTQITQLILYYLDNYTIIQRRLDNYSIGSVISKSLISTRIIDIYLSAQW